uniref:Olfactory receptor n=1 Tax=Esox lucius TaxID=8010 RepID=A0AAY5KHC6_ESOLU
MNSSQFSSFILTGYSNTGQLNYLYFIIITMLYISILFSNTLFVVVICLERKLHKPMYLFLCSLFVNDLFGSIALFPALMTNLISDDHSVSTVHCFLQIFCIYSYANIEFVNVAVMSYDRYLAICYPLQYTILMTPKNVCVLVFLIWLCMFVHMFINVSLTVRLEFLYCDNYLVVKLACSAPDITVKNVYGLCGLVLFLAVPLFTIIFSYIKILTICLKSSTETRQKAVSTCTPHLASLLNFSFGCLINLLQSRFDKPLETFPPVLQTIISVYFLMCQPLFNPIVYGVRMSKIRQACRNILPVHLQQKT